MGSTVDSDYGEQVLICLRRIMQAISLHSRSLVKQVGLTGPQLIFLKTLDKAGEASAGEIAKAISLSQATVTGILERLVKRGLVNRQRSPSDKRRVLIRITPEGEKMLAKAPPLMQASFLEQLNYLEQWEQTMILAALQRIVSLMGAEAFRAVPILTPDPFDSLVDNVSGFVSDDPQAQ
ncbi:MAG: MarR family winged helix-turn-helix transcriptional regulator [Desulfobacteraceae bacterium]